ncbi:MAG TPA: AMP-binding protein [Gemmatimonadales bacterium]|nr:AMP-binding protein [Gemmatimonadales bacterium]
MSTGTVAAPLAAPAWADTRRELGGLPGDPRSLNIAHAAVDRHALGPCCDQLAIRWLGKRHEVHDYSYGRLRTLTNQFANVLDLLGVVPGGRVFALLGRIPELYVTALGTLKHRAVFCPLFSAFGAEPIKARLTIGQAKVLVTTESLYVRKVAMLRAMLPDLEHIVLVGDDDQTTTRGP